MTQREQQILRLIEENPMISQQELAQKLGITRSSVAVHISNLIQKGCIAGRGYVLSSGSYAVVVGGANVDIGGRSAAPLVPADSNPGTITLSLGGVGRNIDHTQRLLGTGVKLLTAYGEDRNGDYLESSCLQLGIDLKHALKLPGESTSTYLYLTGPEGEMALAVSDMSICDRITPEYLAENSAVLRNARAVVADTNIPAESLLWLAENCANPLFIDPVSTTKAKKLLPILSRIHTLKPNRLETELLTSMQIQTKADVAAAAKQLLDTGVQRVFITLGSEGVYAATAEEQLWHKILPGTMVNTTGCGDSFMAALVWAWIEELSLKDTAKAGLAAGSLTMESELTIHPGMSAEVLKERMKEN